MMEQYLSDVVLLCIAVIVVYVSFHYFKLRYVFRHFPVHHIDGEMTLKTLQGKYPKNTPFASCFFQEAIKKCRLPENEGISILWLLRPHVFIYGEKFVKRFYTEPAALDKLKVYDILKEEYGNGLITSKGETWRIHRKLLNPVFNLSKLKENMHIFNRCSLNLVKTLEESANEPTSDTWDYLKLCTFNIMAESILGLNFNNSADEARIRKFQELMESLAEVFMSRVARPWLHWSLMLHFFPSGRKYLRQYEEFRNFTKNVIEDMKKNVICSKASGEEVDNAQSRKSLGRILLEQHLNDPAFTIQDVRDHVTTFMVAGHETTADTLLWCLYALGKHPEVQQKAFEEICCSVHEEEVTYEHLTKLTYMDAVIKETLRLYTTVPAYGRTLEKDIHFENTTFPRGTNIVFFTYMLHRNPNIFPNPEKFDPERFSGETDVQRWTFIPFAEGQRVCIGKKFAMMKMKVMLVHILRRFEVKTLNEIQEKDIFWAVILRSLKPVKMQFMTRHTQIESSLPDQR